jgi:hypothetical protein
LRRFTSAFGGQEPAEPGKIELLRQPLEISHSRNGGLEKPLHGNDRDLYFFVHEAGFLTRPENTGNKIDSIG